MPVYYFDINKRFKRIFFLDEILAEPPETVRTSTGFLWKAPDGM